MKRSRHAAGMKKMKTLFAALVAGAVVYSCGSGGSENAGNKEGPQHDTAAAAPAGTSVIPNERGLELIGSNDCTTCHAIDKKLIGPAYIDVSKKYEATPAVIDTLISKVQHGGSGNWGPIPMIPHPDLSEADAREMIVYILSLKNQ